MRIAGRMKALEKRAREARVGQCRCGALQLVIMWDKRAPVPPPKFCAACGVPGEQLLMDCTGRHPPQEPPRPCQPVSGLMEFYMVTALPDVPNPSWSRS
jgi:hypothetical protein